MRAVGALGPASLRRSAAHLPTGADSEAARRNPGGNWGARPSWQVDRGRHDLMRLRRHSHICHTARSTVTASCKSATGTEHGRRGAATAWPRPAPFRLGHTAGPGACFLLAVHHLGARAHHAVASAHHRLPALHHGLAAVRHLAPGVHHRLAVGHHLLAEASHVVVVDGLALGHHGLAGVDHLPAIGLRRLAVGHHRLPAITHRLTTASHQLTVVAQRPAGVRPRGVPGVPTSGEDDRGHQDQTRDRGCPSLVHHQRLLVSRLLRFGWASRSEVVPRANHQASNVCAGGRPRSAGGTWSHSCAAALPGYLPRRWRLSRPRTKTMREATREVAASPAPATASRTRSSTLTPPAPAWWVSAQTTP